MSTGKTKELRNKGNVRSTVHLYLSPKDFTDKDHSVFEHFIIMLLPQR